MRRLMHTMWGLAALTLMGCSLFNGKEGFLDRAAAKDTSESLMIRRCDADAYKLYCEPDTSAPDCRKHCG